MHIESSVLSDLMFDIMTRSLLSTLCILFEAYNVLVHGLSKLGISIANENTIAMQYVIVPQTPEI